MPPRSANAYDGAKADIIESVAWKPAICPQNCSTQWLPGPKLLPHIAT
jgi:hypothetical protein